jgi:hypothetical protein
MFTASELADYIQDKLVLDELSPLFRDLLQNCCEVFVERNQPIMPQELFLLLAVGGFCEAYDGILESLREQFKAGHSQVYYELNGKKYLVLLSDMPPM